MRNGLALGKELDRRKIKKGVVCVACGREEDVMHRFWRCPHSACFWKMMRSEMGVPVAIPPVYVDSQSALQRWMIEWLAEASSDQREVMIQSLYGLCLDRNEARDGKRIVEPLAVAKTVCSYMNEWRAVQVIREKTHLSPNHTVRWHPPPDGWHKANSDGATLKAGERSGGGVVIRDHHGAFRATACHCFASTSDPEIAEILACRQAVKLARELHVEKLEMELDCKNVVNMLNDQTKNLGVAGPVVEEIKGTLQDFEAHKISWTRRSANSAAHILAKLGVSDELCNVWLQSPPDCILQVVAAEIPDFVE